MFFLVYFRQNGMEMTKKSASSGKAANGAGDGGGLALLSQSLS